MSRETDWHVFDKACDVVGMALRGTANDVAAQDAAAMFRAVYDALREAATGIESAGQKAGF
jgi:hypothetical protein